MTLSYPHRSRADYNDVDRKDDDGNHIHEDYEMMPIYHRMPAVVQPTGWLNRLWHGLYRESDKLDRHSRLLWGGCNGPKYLTWLFRFVVLWISIYVAVFVKVFGPQLIYGMGAFSNVTLAVRSAVFVAAVLPMPLIFFPLLRDAVSLYVMTCNVELMKDPAVVTRVYQYQRGTHAVSVLKLMTRIKKNEQLRQRIKVLSKERRSTTRCSGIMATPWDVVDDGVPTVMRRASAMMVGRMRSRLSSCPSPTGGQTRGSAASVRHSIVSGRQHIRVTWWDVMEQGPPELSLSSPRPTLSPLSPYNDDASEDSHLLGAEGRQITMQSIARRSVARRSVLNIPGMQDADDETLEFEFRDMFQTYTAMYKRKE